MIKLVTSWDDGSIYDLRLADLLKKYSMPATFYYDRDDERWAFLGYQELTEDEIKQIAAKFEIGAHSLSHPHLRTLSDDEVYEELMGCKLWLEKLIGRPVVKFSFPFGEYDDRIVGICKEVGFTEARTIEHRHTDHPGYLVHPTLKVGEGFTDWFEYGVATIKKIVKAGEGYYHLRGHSGRLQQENTWGKLEELLKIIKEELCLLPNSSEGKT